MVKNSRGGIGDFCGRFNGSGHKDGETNEKGCCRSSKGGFYEGSDCHGGLDDGLEIEAAGEKASGAAETQKSQIGKFANVLDVSYE